MYAMSDLLQLTVSENASDLHLSVGVLPVIRVHDVLQRVEGSCLQPHDSEEVMRSIRRRISVRCSKRSPPARSRASGMTVSSNSKSAACAKPKKEPLGNTVIRATAEPIACSARRIEQPIF